MSCCRYNIDLQWLNTLGGWEHWSFTSQKSYGFDIGKTETIQRDIFQNWDTDFIAGLTESEHISIKANKTITVRSQDLTIQQIEAIARIKFSIKVNDETDLANLVTVLVDKGSISYRTDNDKRHSIEFGIVYPSEVIQTQ
tara:strand:- start:11 stop:430 length:420 start_codon:yes stop_codon:yes gene_type:complete